MNTIYPEKLVEYCRQELSEYFGTPFSPIRLQDDGEGLFIAAWPEGVTVPTVEQIEAWTPSPVPAVQAMLTARGQVAASKIQALKASCAVALMAGGMSESDTMSAGSQLVLDHAAKIQAYILAGGNPVAGQALIDEIVAAPPAWWNPQMLALFEAELL